jgi:hypothetical protein
MIKYITYPAITNLLEQCRKKQKGYDFSVDTVVISDFSENKKNIHSGLLEAVKYRLTHRYCYIIFLAFHSKEELFRYDVFNILSLPGTIFIRLPFKCQEFYSVVEECNKIKLKIPQEEWTYYSTNVSKALIKDKISVLKHGNKLDFVNQVTGPLRAATVILPSFPDSKFLIKQYLQSFRDYSKKDEIEELILLSKTSASLSDNFLTSVSQFVNGLQQLILFAEMDEININQLIFTIDLINETLSKIQS